MRGGLLVALALVACAPPAPQPKPKAAIASERVVFSAESGASAPDMIDLRSVQWHDSPPDIASWPIAKRLAAIELKDDGGDGYGVRRVLDPYVPTRDADDWPDVVPPEWDGPLRDTLWLIVRCPDQRWHGAATIEYWHDRVWSGAALLRHYKEWAYHWDPLLSCAPARGATIGFLVSSGQTRLNKQIYGLRNGQPVKERSNAVTVTLVENAVTTFPIGTPPTPDPVPPVTPPVTPPDPDRLRERIEALEHQIEQVIQALAVREDEAARMAARLATVEAETDAHAKVPHYTRCEAAIQFGATKVPIACRLLE